MAENKEESIPTVEIYGQFEGIKGFVKEPEHEGWMKLNSCQWGIGCGISSGGGWGRRTPEQIEAEKKKREEEESAAKEKGETEEEEWGRKLRAVVQCSQPSLSEVTVSKESDAASPLLLHLALMRKPTRKVTIEIVQAADKSITRFVLHDVFISGFSLSIGSGRRSNGSSSEPNESISLNYQKIEMGVFTPEHKNVVGHSLHSHETHFNGELIPPFWPNNSQDEDDY